MLTKEAVLFIIRIISSHPDFNHDISVVNWSDIKHEITEVFGKTCHSFRDQQIKCVHFKYITFIYDSGDHKHENQCIFYVTIYVYM